MFDGKMLRELAGMPMRRIDLANSPLALAEPDPFTLANLTTKSLTLWIAAVAKFDCIAIGSVLMGSATSRPSHCHVEKEFSHVPGSGRAALSAQATMQADILVLDHDTPGLQ